MYGTTCIYLVHPSFFHSVRFFLSIVPPVTSGKCAESNSDPFHACTNYRVPLDSSLPCARRSMQGQPLSSCTYSELNSTVQKYYRSIFVKTNAKFRGCSTGSPHGGRRCCCVGLAGASGQTPRPPGHCRLPAEAPRLAGGWFERVAEAARLAPRLAATAALGCGPARAAEAAALGRVTRLPDMAHSLTRDQAGRQQSCSCSQS